MRAYTLIRSKRRTIAIHITDAATVEIRAPILAPVSAIDAFVASKEDWIASRLSERQERLIYRATFTLRYGDSLPLCGQLYPLRAEVGNSAGYDAAGFYVPPDMPPEHIKRAVVAIYKQAAKSILTQKTAYYAKLLGVTPSGVKINSAKTRWGSCSGRNSINYSWRLVMADDEVVNYVVVHELAHIIEHNHSERFWKIVESIFPDYRLYKSHLRNLSDKLARENWD